MANKMSLRFILLVLIFLIQAEKKLPAEANNGMQIIFKIFR